MDKTTIRRIHIDLTLTQKRKLRQMQKLVEKELPDLIARNQRAHVTRQGDSFSATLRNAIQSSKWLLPQLASRSSISMERLSDFLTGEKTLTTDQVDSLVALLGLQLTPATKRSPKPRTAKAS